MVSKTPGGSGGVAGDDKILDKAKGEAEGVDSQGRKVKKVKRMGSSPGGLHHRISTQIKPPPTPPEELKFTRLPSGYAARRNLAGDLILTTPKGKPVPPAPSPLSKKAKGKQEKENVRTVKNPVYDAKVASARAKSSKVAKNVAKADARAAKAEAKMRKKLGGAEEASPIAGGPSKKVRAAQIAKLVVAIRPFLETVGVFRLSGDKRSVEGLLGRLSNKDLSTIEGEDVHVLTGAFKTIIRDNFFIPQELQEEYLQADTIEKMEKLFQKLDPSQQKALKALEIVYDLTIEKKEINKMRSENLDIVFGPNVAGEYMGKDMNEAITFSNQGIASCKVLMEFLKLERQR